MPAAVIEIVYEIFDIFEQGFRPQILDWVRFGAPLGVSAQGCHVLYNEMIFEKPNSPKVDPQQELAYIRVLRWVKMHQNDGSPCFFAFFFHLAYVIPS